MNQLKKILNLKNNEDGKYLIQLSRDAIIATMNRITTEFNSIPHNELVALCATLKANLDLFELFVGIEDKIEQFELLYSSEIESDDDN